MKEVVISITGQDQPGILAATARTLALMGCNISNVSQTLLHNVFGALIRAEMPEAVSEAELEDALLRNSESFDLDIFVRSYAHKPVLKRPPSQPFILTTHGPDRPGIVAAIASALAEFGANITDLQAVFDGPASPDRNLTIFHVDVPESVALNDLKARLAAVAAEIKVDVNLQHRRLFEMMHRI